MSSSRKIASFLLLPLTIWYAVGVALRNIFFEMGILKQETPHITTIGVGNLSTGGTGKTPHVEYLLRLLGSQYRTVYLSRGYRRKSKGFVKADGNPDPLRLGDEAAMIARKFPHVDTVVCEKRMRAIRRLMEPPQPVPAEDASTAAEPAEPVAVADTTPELIVMDDVYQHRFVKPTLNILLTEFNRPYYNDLILPYGNLREFRKARFRANIIIVTKCPAKLNPIDRHNITNSLGVLPYQKVFFSYFEYGRPKAVYGDGEADLNAARQILLFTGIARPEPLLRYVKQGRTMVPMLFGDHHEYTASDLRKITERFAKLNSENKMLLTTEKDAARLQTPQARQMLEGLPLYYIPVEVKFHDTVEYNFNSTILSTVKENISFLDKLKTSKLANY